MNAAVVVFSYYPDDPRVRRETEALEAEGMSIDLICLRGDGEAPRERLGAVTVYRLPIRRKRGGKLRYIAEYLAFLLLAFWKVTFLHLRRRYRLVHVHNMPDFLVFSAIAPRLTGAKVILDLHDTTPEVYMTKYGLAATHPAIGALAALERWSIRFAHLVLTPNKAFRDRFIERGAPPGKIEIVMNSPQETIFRPREAEAEAGSRERRDFRIMFHGTVVERHGLDTALFAIDRIRSEIPLVRFEVYGDGDYVRQFTELVQRLNLGAIVTYHGHVPLEEIARAILGIDVGLIPNKKSPFTEINLPTRIFEYLSMGKQVISPRTRGILDYFDDTSLNFFEAGDAESLAATLRAVWRDRARGERILERGRAVYEAHSWERQRRHFVRLVARLVGLPPRRPRQPAPELPDLVAASR